MKKYAYTITRYSLVLACILYVTWDLGFQRLFSTFISYNMFFMLFAIPAGLLVFVLQGARLYYIAQKRATPSHATLSCIFGTALNNIFPARLGEIGKAFYLKQRTGILVREGLGCIFWERFLDLNMLLILAFVAGFSSSKEVYWVPVAIIVTTIWVGILLCLKLEVVRSLLLKFTPAKIKGFTEDLLTHLLGLATPKRLFEMGALSILTWLGLVAFFSFILVGIANLSLTMPQLVTIFVVSSLGMSLPSSPGGLGVFEASMVISLGWFGYDRETALSCALLLRVCQNIPVTIWGAAMLGRKDLSITSIKQSYDKKRTQDLLPTKSPDNRV